MGLQSITNINVDFYDKKYILINAKQYDKSSRFLSVTCYNHGEIYPINAGEHSAYIRYKKADDYGVFNFCEIDRKGKIIVELTEQMLASDGICCADLVLVNKGKAQINSDTGEIIAMDNTAILSTMTFYIDVSETTVENSEIETSKEFIQFNAKLEEYWADFEDVMKTSKSWAYGNTGIRDGENTNNSMYWAEQSRGSASAANTSALNAAESERIAGEYKNTAIEHSGNAYTYMTDAKSSMNSANESETNAINSATAAATSEANAKISEINSKTSETNALSYKEIVENINDSIVGSINTLASNGNIGSFIFIKAVTFEELKLLSDDKKATGYVYCITDDFTTDNSFVNGIGLSYTAGTNVYYVIDEEGKGKWDCLGGSASSTATVSEVKDYLGI